MTSTFTIIRSYSCFARYRGTQNRRDDAEIRITLPTYSTCYIMRFRERRWSSGYSCARNEDRYSLTLVRAEEMTEAAVSIALLKNTSVTYTVCTIYVYVRVQCVYTLFPESSTAYIPQCTMRGTRTPFAWCVRCE